MSMQYRTLGKTGLRVSALGYGAGPLGDEFGTIDPGEGERSVHFAIDQGITFFDTAPYYGRTLSEARLGAALAGKREKVVLCTKLGRYGKQDFDFSAGRVASSIDESLQRLRTGYVDLLIAHDIEFADREQIIGETIPAMRRVQEAGKARFIGISGLPLRILADVAERGRVDFVLSYCRYTLLNRDLDRWLTPVVEKHDLGLILAAAVHMGILSAQGPQPWHPAQPETKEIGRKVVDLCREHGVDVATVAIAFTMGHQRAASTLVGMPRVSEVQQNLEAMEYRIPPELMRKINDMVDPVRDVIWPSGRPENDD